MTGLKLYVWHNVLYDYTAGVMFAVAHDETEARDLVREAAPHAECDLGKKPVAYDTPVGFAVWGGG